MLKVADHANERAVFLLDRLELGGPLQVCDVGARPQTTPPYKLLHELGACHVWAFEPDEAAFAALETLDHNNATYFKTAIGKPGTATFHRHPIGSISSIYPIAEAPARFLGKFHWLNRDVQQIPMSLQSLDDIEGLPKIDVLKIDIQGGEFDVFDTGRSTLSDAVAIIPEVRFYRMYDGEPLWRDVDSLLDDMGFKLHKFMHAKQVQLPSPQRKQMGKRNAGGSQLLDGDAVYIRDLENLDSVQDTQLAKLAIAAETMFQSYDLACMCLFQLEERDVLEAGCTQAYFDLLPDEIKAKNS